MEIYRRLRLHVMPILELAQGDSYRESYGCRWAIIGRDNCTIMDSVLCVFHYGRGLADLSSSWSRFNHRDRYREASRC